MTETKDGQTPIYHARVRTGLSLSTAAELLELSRRQLSDIEHGRTTPSAGELERILSKLADAANAGNA